MDDSILDRLINSGLPFAIYKLPGSKEVCLVMQNNSNILTVNKVEESLNCNGFIISPFITSKQTPAVSIRPDIFLKGMNEIACFLTDFFRNDITFHPPEYHREEDADGFEEYKTNFEIFHKALTDKKFDKLVLSRNLTVSKKDGFSLKKVLESAIEKYPNAFIYLLNTSHTGIWFGCSPELLLSGKDREWRTAALAGTRKTETGNPAWDNKNIAEQKIVSDFIAKQLENLQITYKKSEIHTVCAGNIEHCKADFTISLDSPAKAGILLKALHPTPAVSGFPKDEAIKFIAENERRSRLYYSGFVGVANISGSTDLFVNIRCMQVFNSKLRLYAGGGLTGESQLNDEWRETEYKLQTLLSLFETEVQPVSSIS